MSWTCLLVVHGVCVLCTTFIARALIATREVAEEYKLPLETDKEEVLHLRKSRKKKNTDRRFVK